jgi:hypothetical protein
VGRLTWPVWQVQEPVGGFTGRFAGCQPRAHVSTTLPDQGLLPYSRTEGENFRSYRGRIAFRIVAATGWELLRRAQS